MSPLRCRSQRRRHSTTHKPPCSCHLSCTSIYPGSCHSFSSFSLRLRRGSAFNHDICRLPHSARIFNHRRPIRQFFRPFTLRRSLPASFPGIQPALPRMATLSHLKFRIPSHCGASSPCSAPVYPSSTANGSSAGRHKHPCSCSIHKLAIVHIGYSFVPQACRAVSASAPFFLYV
ncbi:hypothetical protein BDN70DRAFT_236030 [Pholiota conissans]|uniref:Uncharacterized protein n=1 Tax=Pholiota conissans TaxID=109636 RepID=A0A9P6D7U8_9AGAR|nr:hypothetical protein BDN70DRAFT_236030 [Pholiota conissans]